MPTLLQEGIRQWIVQLAVPEESVRGVSRALAEYEPNQAVRGLEVGARAPDFELPAVSGGTVSLRGRLAQGPVVLTFYRGDWCPICNLQLSAFQRALPEIHKAGATLLAVSPQDQGHGISLREAKELGFDLLSDLAQTVIRDYQLQLLVPPEVKDAFLNNIDLDLSRENADGTWRLPIPGTFIVDRDGMISRRHVNPDYLERMEPEDVVAALEELEDHRPTVADS